MKHHRMLFAPVRNKTEPLVDLIPSRHMYSVTAKATSMLSFLFYQEEKNPTIFNPDPLPEIPLSPSTKHMLASLTIGESHSSSTSEEGKQFISTSFYTQKILSTPTFSVFTGKIINSNLKKKNRDRNRETNRE